MVGLEAVLYVQDATSHEVLMFIGALGINGCHGFSDN